MIRWRSDEFSYLNCICTFFSNYGLCTIQMPHASSVSLSRTIIIQRFWYETAIAALLFGHYLHRRSALVVCERRKKKSQQQCARAETTFAGCAVNFQTVLSWTLTRKGVFNLTTAITAEAVIVRKYIYTRDGVSKNIEDILCRQIKNVFCLEKLKVFLNSLSTVQHKLNFLKINLFLF